MERMALLCGTEKEAERIGRACARAHIDAHVVKTERDSLDEAISVMPVYYAKGLEFVGVIVVEPKDSGWDAWTQYILCTRALHQLVHLKEE